MATTKQIPVTDAQRKAGILAITVNEPSQAEVQAAADAAARERVTAEVERVKLYQLALAVIEAEGWDPLVELDKLGL